MVDPSTTIPTNVVSYSPTSTDGPQIYCVNAQQPKYETNGQGYRIGPSPPCCLDYKARFCCKVRPSKPSYGVLKPFRGGKQIQGFEKPLTMFELITISSIILDNVQKYLFQENYKFIIGKDMIVTNYWHKFIVNKHHIFN